MTGSIHKASTLLQKSPFSSASCIRLRSEKPIARNRDERQSAEECVKEINDSGDALGFYRMRKDNRLEMQLMILPASEEVDYEEMADALNASFRSSAAVIAEAVRRNHGAE